MAARRCEISLRVLKIFFNARREISYLQAAVKYSIYRINTNEVLDHFRKASIGAIFIFNHRNSDLFTCEDIKFSRESSLGISLVFI